MSDTPGYFTPAAPPAAPPPEAEVAAQLAAGQAASPGGVTETDVAKLVAGMATMQARLDALEEERAAGAAVPVQATAEALRDILRLHDSQSSADHGDALRLADDAVDAAKNAAESGDGSQVHVIAGKLARALKRADPGAGDHHWYRQAIGFAEVHLPDAADQLVPKRTAVASGSTAAPAQVVQGSVTG